MRLPVLAILIFSIFALSQQASASVTWSYSAHGAITGKPLLMAGKAVFSTYEGNIYSFSAGMGSIEWSYEMPGRLPVPAVASSADAIVAADSSGALRFISLAGKQMASASLRSAPLYLAGSDGNAYVSEKDRVQAFSPAGKLIWEIELGAPAGPISAYGDSVYFTSGRKLYSIEAKKGKQNWAVPAEESFMSAPLESDGSVYVGATDGRLYAYDAVGGHRRWFFQARGWVESTPAKSGDAIFFGSNDGYFYSVTDSGSLRFKVKTGEAVWSEPALYNSSGRQLAVFSSNDGNVYCVDASSGEAVWSYSAGGRVGPVSVRSGQIFFGTSSGQFYSLWPSPICSFSWPRTGSVAGDWPMTVEGTAYSDSGVALVEVRREGGQWQPASGFEKWQADVDFNGLPYGSFKVECRVSDMSGVQPSGDYSSISLIKNPAASLRKMFVVAPSEAGANETITIRVQDSRGNDMSGVSLSVAGEKQIGDSPFSVVLGKSGGVPILIEKPGFEPVSFKIAGFGGGDLLAPLIAAVLLCALGFFAYKKLIAKK